MKRASPCAGAESEGSGEKPAAAGRQWRHHRCTNTGTIVFSTPDGFGSVSMNGTIITGKSASRSPACSGRITITA